MTENRASTPTDLAGRWRRLCEAMLGELRPETGSWWRSGAFWLLSWVMRRRVQREAAALAAMIQGMMAEVLATLEAFQAGKIPPVAQPEAGAEAAGTRTAAMPGRGAMGDRTFAGAGLGFDAMDSRFRGNDGYLCGERADTSFSGAGLGCGAMDSSPGSTRGLRGNDGYGDGERAHAGLTGAGPCYGTLDSGLRRNDGGGSDGDGRATPPMAPRPRERTGHVAPLRPSAFSAVQNPSRGENVCRAIIPRARPPPRPSPAANGEGRRMSISLRYRI